MEVRAAGQSKSPYWQEGSKLQVSEQRFRRELLMDSLRPVGRALDVNSHFPGYCA